MMAEARESRQTRPVMRKRRARMRLGLMAGAPPVRGGAGTVLECLGGRPISATTLRQGWVSRGGDDGRAICAQGGRGQPNEGAC